MNQPSVAIGKELLERGLRGDPDAIGQLLELHRPYLRLLAERSLHGDIRARVDASDIVQQTCMAAMKGVENLEAKSTRQFLVWLRHIHQHQIVDCLRVHGLAEKRAVGREQATDDHLCVTAEVDPLASTPSHRLMAEEDAVILARALDQLPESQQEAIRLKYLDGLTLIEAAQSMATTKYAVVGLLNRGLKKLRMILRNETER